MNITTSSMNKNIIRLGNTGSTNDYLRSAATPTDDSMIVAVSDYQTAGRGQGCNSWESECGKNLLVSILVTPHMVPIEQQFVLSMAGALALKDTLDEYCGAISLKWPNDIYWFNRKISGTLIETSVSGKTISRCIYGIGLNVNQEIFRSDAPNPISLLNITGYTTPLDRLLTSVLNKFEKYYSMATEGKYDVIVDKYNSALFRRYGFHKYIDTATGQPFEARMERVGTDGLLRLADKLGNRLAYSLKEIKFVI